MREEDQRERALTELVDEAWTVDCVSSWKLGGSEGEDWHDRGPTHARQEKARQGAAALYREESRLVRLSSALGTVAPSVRASQWPAPPSTAHAQGASTHQHTPSTHWRILAFIDFPLYAPAGPSICERKLPRPGPGSYGVSATPSFANMSQVSMIIDDKDIVVLGTHTRPYHNEWDPLQLAGTACTATAGTAALLYLCTCSAPHSLTCSSTPLRVLVLVTGRASSGLFARAWSPMRP